MKILVVEDNEDSRNLLVKQLSAYGHEVMAATNGAEALEQALAQPPDIIVSDILMPKMDGYQLCHECKQNDKLKDIPFIFYTATYTSEEDEKFALSLGANTLIRKPTEPDIFVQMLSELFEKAKSGALAPDEVAPLEPSLFHTEYSKRIFAKLEDKVAHLEAEIAQRKQIEHNLNERVKELQCLYGISDLEKRGIPLEELFQRTVDLLPPAWQYPEVTCARLTLNSQEFCTKNFRKTSWKQTSDIIVQGHHVGSVEVCYLEERPEIDEGPFLKEERELITAIARQLGETIERKQSEEALRESEEKLRLMFDSVTEGITVSDLDGKITDLNTHVVHMHGYDNKEELIGRSAFELMAEKDRARAMENMKRTLEDGFVKNIEYTFLTRDGSEFPAELSAAVLKDASGKPTGFIAITEDITERKKMEEQFIVTNRLASIGELSSGFAHEINNPLTGIIVLSELVLDKDLPDDVKEDIVLINREAERAAGVVRNLLTFARKHEIEKTPVNINSIIEKVLELRAYEQKVNNIEVNTQFAPDLPEITADGFQLQQSFLNIIINAEHFMIEAHGRGTFSITTERVGDIIRASFADDGPGIAKENLRHLFDPFFTTKEVGKGTGLGLSICHGIITEHGGRIYTKNGLGKGATFIVELPISK